MAVIVPDTDSTCKCIRVQICAPRVCVCARARACVCKCVNVTCVYVRVWVRVYARARVCVFVVGKGGCTFVHACTCVHGICVLSPVAQFIVGGRRKHLCTCAGVRSVCG